MKSLVLFCCSFMVCLNVYADVAVVVAKNSSIANLDVSELERLYTGKSKTVGGTEVVPVNQAEVSAITEQFNRLVLNKSNSQVKAYWSKLVFTGKGQPPKEVDSNTKMIDAIKGDPSAIGYIDASAVTGDIKVLATLK